MMGPFDRDTVARACRRFSSRIVAVIAADGDFIELVNSQYIPLVYFLYFNKIGPFSAVLWHV
jgi:hypothetical protein